MSEETRSYFAIVLGVSATAGLLAGLVPLLTPLPDGARRTDRLGALAWILLLGAWLAGAVALASRHALRPWHVAAVFVASILLTQLGGPIARSLRGVSGVGALALSTLRLVGALRFAAMSASWLPSGYACVTGIAESLVALSAVALMVRGDVRAVRAWSVAAFVTLGVGWALQGSEVRPLPAFEALYDGFLLPLFALAAVAAWRSVLPAERVGAPARVDGAVERAAV